MIYFIFFLFFIMFDIKILNSSIKYISNIYDNVKNKEIFQENFHSLIHYTISNLILSVIFFNNIDCINTNGTFMLKTECSENLNLLNLYNLLIIYESSYYIISLIYLYFYKKIKRKDQLIMYIHHILTMLLFKCSYINNISIKFGIYILFTHNLCDIPLNIYMLLDNHMNFNKTKLIETNKIIIYYQDLMAILSIIFFGYLRMIMFGSLVFHILYNSYHNYIITFNIFLKLCFYIAKLLVLILYCLNIFWFYLMIRGIIDKIYNKKNDYYK